MSTRAAERRDCSKCSADPSTPSPTFTPPSACGWSAASSLGTHPRGAGPVRDARGRFVKGARPEITGEMNPAWKGGRSDHGSGYVRIRVDGRYVFEHRYVMEQHLGRHLEPWEQVHHRNK